MDNAKFSIAEAISYGWNAFKNHIGFFIGLMVLMILVTGTMNAVIVYIFPRPSLLSFVARILAATINIFLSMAVVRLALDIYDLGNPQLSKIGDLFPLFPSFFGAKIIFGLIVGGLPALALLAVVYFNKSAFGILGLILFIFPGLFWLFMYMYQSYLVVDRAMGPIEALGESRAITDGSKVSLALLTLVLLIVNLVGLICLVIGLFVTIPVSMMASVYVYRQLSPRIATGSSAVV